MVGRDVDDAALERRARASRRASQRACEKGQLSDERRRAARERLTLARDLARLADVELVIEAIVEELGAKRELFAALDARLPRAGRPRDQHLGALGDGDRRRQRAGRSAASGCTSSTPRR